MKKLLLFSLLFSGVMYSSYRGYDSTPAPSLFFMSDYDQTLKRINGGGDVNARWRPSYKNTVPLHYVIGSGAVQALVQKGADIEAQDNYGDTPLYYAIGQGDKYLVQTFLEQGAKVNVRNQEGKTPLHYAGLKTDITKALLKAGANVHISDNKGKTPLHCARKVDVAEALINAGADVNAQDEEGNTPLHYAKNTSYNKTNDMVKLLLSKGANANVQNKNGETPLDIFKKELEKWFNVSHVYKDLAKSIDSLSKKQQEDAQEDAQALARVKMHTKM